MSVMRFALALGVVAAISLSVVVPVSIAGDEVWSTASLAGYRVRDLILHPSDPSLVVAVAADDVMVSHDGGATWSSLGLGQVGALAISPTSSEHWWASVGEQLFVSANGGVSWTQSGAGLTSSLVYVAVDPNDAAQMYASTHDSLYRSIDAGETWTSAGLPVRGRAAAIAFGPSGSNTVYVALADQQGQLWKSSDGGNAWASIGEQVPAQYTPTFYALAANSQGHVYAAADNGVFRTSDGGASWSTLSQDWASQVVIVPGSDATIVVNFPYSGLFMSSADLSEATRIGEDVFQGVNDIALAPSDGETVYVANDSGVYVSTDAGRNWSSPNTIALSQVWTSMPGGSGTLFAADYYYGQLYRSTDSGSTWAPVDLSGTQTVIGSRHAESRIYAGTQQGLFVSDNVGASWRATGLPTSIAVRALAEHPTEPGTLYVGKDDGLLRSSDDGSTWVSLNLPVGTGRVAQIALTTAGTAMYVVAGNSVLLSENDGQSWSKLYDSNRTVPTVSLSSEDPDRVYIGSPEGVGISQRRGAGLVFQPLVIDTNQAINGRVSVVEDPRSSHTLYASITEDYYGAQRRLLMSSDYGLTWSDITQGLSVGRDVQSFAVETDETPSFYVILRDGLGGVWQYKALSLPPTPTPIPTNTPIPTRTPVPTFTALPKSTAGPTPTAWQQSAGTAVAQVTSVATTAARPTQLILTPAPTPGLGLPDLGDPLILAGAGLVCAGAGVVSVAGLFGLSRRRRSRRAIEQSPDVMPVTVPVVSTAEQIGRETAVSSLNRPVEPPAGQSSDVAPAANTAPTPSASPPSAAAPEFGRPRKDSSQPAEHISAMRFCSNCGKQNVVTAKFCMQCGQPLPTS